MLHGNTGFPKISRALEVNGSPMAEYVTDIDRTSFLATIHIHPAFLVQGIEMSEKMSEKMSGKMSERILESILKDSSLTIAELSDSLKISTWSVERALKELKEYGYLERIGSRKEGYWKVNIHPDKIEGEL